MVQDVRQRLVCPSVSTWAPKVAPLEPDDRAHAGQKIVLIASDGSRTLLDRTRLPYGLTQVSTADGPVTIETHQAGNGRLGRPRYTIDAPRSVRITREASPPSG